MRREYAVHEWQPKIEHLTEYYKYNRSLPRLYEPTLTTILEKYHNRLRDYDFKVVKAALKREQGISLTSQCNESSFPRSDIEVKSRYSTVLHALDNNNDSDLLHDICHEVNQLLGPTQLNTTFKGQFHETGKHFQEFLDRQQKKHNKVNGSGQLGKKSQCPSFQLPTHNKENTLKTGLNFMKRKVAKGKKSIEKTTANQTISREERTKKT